MIYTWLHSFLLIIAGYRIWTLPSDSHCEIVTPLIFGGKGKNFKAFQALMALLEKSVESGQFGSW